MTVAKAFAIAVAFSAAVRPSAANATEAFLDEFLAAYCAGCHSGSEPAGGFRADPSRIDPGDSESQHVWERAAFYVSQSVMPPEGAERPPPVLRQRFATGLAEALGEGGRPQGLVRRLNRIEYLNSLRDLLGIREIRLPVTFPDDSPGQRFDTMAADAHLTPGHLDAYHDVAVDIADRLVPLPGRPLTRSAAVRPTVGQDPVRTKFWVRDGDDSGLYFTGVNIAGWSGALWIKAFAAPSSGIYTVRMKVSAEASRGADGQPLRLGFYALNPSDYDLPKRALRARLPRVGSLDVRNSDPEELVAELHLEEGEAFHVYCENRLSKPYPDALLRQAGNTEDLRRLLAKYLEEAQASSEPTVRFERMEIGGPVGPLPRQRAFLPGGERGAVRDYAEAVLVPLAEQAYRRPLADHEVRELLDSAVHHAVSTGPEYGVHYGVRRILLSPYFLYREVPGRALDDYGLASRLSYFLWSSMPDRELFGLAAAGKLSDGLTLAAQVRRMVRHPKGQRFVKHFSGQWLGNRKASSIMVCDVRHVWSELIRYGIVRSTELFFDEILQRNLSVRQFIDSGFTYANEPMRIAWGIPGSEVDLRRLEADQRQSLLWPEPARLDLHALGDEFPAHVASRGGALGLSSVLLATSDGVDSSPVLRGVWALENLFGAPPPPPPSDVPALVADTSQARTVREILAAHQQVDSCAGCHRSIDPIGLALENYDASGNWRAEYYREAGTSVPQHPVETAGELRDGTRLQGPQSLKRHLLEQPGTFTRTLGGLLLQYATGRELTAEDRRVVAGIVAAEPEGGYGMQDLIVEVVRSAGFRAN